MKSNMSENNIFFKNIKNIALKIREFIASNEDFILSDKNKHGDTQTNFDILIDEIIINEFSKTNYYNKIYSEEREKEVVSNSNSDFNIFIDPVDGSKNSLINGNFGSFFGLYNKKKIICAAYILFGPKTIIVIADDKVNEYTLINDEFKLSQKDIKIKKSKNLIIGGIHNGYNENYKNLLNEILLQNPRIVYNPALVANVHFILKEGGVYVYPSTKEEPAGKIRLFFESKILGFIIEKADGVCFSDKKRILNEDGDVKTKTPLFFGENNQILQNFLNNKNNRKL